VYPALVGYWKTANSAKSTVIKYTMNDDFAMTFMLTIEEEKND
jgi:hypothetical protein